MNHTLIRLALAGFSLAALHPAWGGGLLAVVNPAERGRSDTERAVTASARYFAASDYTSMRHFSDDWPGPYTPRKGKNLALAFARADVSARYASWSAGYFYRQDILLESNKDLTDIVHTNKTRLPVPAGRSHDIHLAMDGFEAQGIRLDKAFTWKAENAWELTFGVGASLMKGQRTRIGQARGSAFSTASGYAFNVNLTDADSKKTFFFMAPGDVTGAGHALDLGLRLQWQDGKRLDLAINDLAGEIRWKNLPQSARTANSATATRDDQGYIAFNPTVSGRNARVDLTQRLDPKGSIEFHAPLAEGLSANLGAQWTKDNLFPRLGLAYAAVHGIVVVADYDTRFKTFGLGATWKEAYLAARTQSLNFDQSRAYGVEAGLVLKF